MRAAGLVNEVQACTGLQVKSYRKITKGWENIILEVNDQYIFRFPMFRGSWSRMQKEFSLLPWLAPRLSVPIPAYEFIWDGDRSHPQRFAGYKKITGVPMLKGNFRRAWVDRLGQDLGRLLTELHSFDLADRELKTVKRHTVESWVESNRMFYRQIRKLVFPILNRTERALAEAFWKQFFDEFTDYDFMPTLIHSDLTGGNILIDPSKAKLTGIIDWGDAKVADPAFDFVGILEVNKSLGQRSMDCYGGPKSGFRERADLYLKTIPFGEISWGVRQKSKHFVELGLRHLHQRLPFP